MKKIFPLTLLILSILLTSCGDSQNDGFEFAPITDATLSGTIFGESFTAVGGVAFERGSFITINITNVVIDCNPSDYDLFISTEFPSKTGAGIYEGLNVIFNKKGETPLNFIGATAQVTSITNTEINIKLNAKPSSENNIEGTFTVKYCN